LRTLSSLRFTGKFILFHYDL